MRVKPYADRASAPTLNTDFYFIKMPRPRARVGTTAINFGASSVVCLFAATVVVSMLHHLRVGARLTSTHARRLCSSSTVSIDVSRLRRTAAAAHVHEPATGLLRELQSRIRFQGSMTVAEYMTAALTHPVHGYYMQRDVFGKQGDFVTSPEISQIFGDLLGVWCVSAWEQPG